MKSRESDGCLSHVAQAFVVGASLLFRPGKISAAMKPEIAHRTQPALSEARPLQGEIIASVRDDDQWATHVLGQRKKERTQSPVIIQGRISDPSLTHAIRDAISDKVDFVVNFEEDQPS